MDVHLLVTYGSSQVGHISLVKPMVNVTMIHLKYAKYQEIGSIIKRARIISRQVRSEDRIEVDDVSRSVFS